MEYLVTECACVLVLGYFICDYICSPTGQGCLRNAELFNKKRSLTKPYPPAAKFHVFLVKLYGLTEVSEMKEAGQ